MSNKPKDEDQKLTAEEALFSGFEEEFSELTGNKTLEAHELDQGELPYSPVKAKTVTNRSTSNLVRQDLARFKRSFTKSMFVMRRLTGITQFLQGHIKSQSDWEAFNTTCDTLTILQSNYDASIVDGEQYRKFRDKLLLEAGELLVKHNTIKIRATSASKQDVPLMSIKAVLTGSPKISPKWTLNDLIQIFSEGGTIEKEKALTRCVLALENVDDLKGKHVVSCVLEYWEAHKEMLELMKAYPEATEFDIIECLWPGIDSKLAREEAALMKLNLSDLEDL